MLTLIHARQADGTLVQGIDMSQLAHSAAAQAGERGHFKPGDACRF